MNEKELRKTLLQVVSILVISSFGAGFLGGAFAFRYLKPIWQSAEITNPKALGSEGGSYEDRLIGAVKKSEGAVVSVVATKDLPVLEQYYINPFEEFFPDSDFFNFQFQIPQYRQKGTKPQEVSAGTGFVIDSRGYLVTNRHVVEDEKAKYTVLTNDGKKYEAKIIAKDPVEDFAVLKIDKTDLPALNLGDSEKLVLGQTVIAIGNALGEFKNTVSVGVISGLNRSLQASDGLGNVSTLTDVIQTDAAINRGNSGGPLINLSGEVVGLNTAMVSGAQNIGFAIPINKIKNALNQALNTGEIKVPFLGIRYVMVNPSIEEAKNLAVDYGALIVSGDNGEEAIVKDSPAQKANLKEGDVITEINGKKINDNYPLASAIRDYKVGDKITLRVLREGKFFETTVILEERKN
ncbi:MAG: trypsin-like peptidase domain-containing protein [Candidatus Paceibacterota bacterium]